MSFWAFEPIPQKGSALKLSQPAYPLPGQWCAPAYPSRKKRCLLKILTMRNDLIFNKAWGILDKNVT
jgi:hypothetical protein